MLRRFFANSPKFYFIFLLSVSIKSQTGSTGKCSEFGLPKNMQKFINQHCQSVLYGNLASFSSIFVFVLQNGGKEKVQAGILIPVVLSFWSEKSIPMWNVNHLQDELCNPIFRSGRSKVWHWHPYRTWIFLWTKGYWLNKYDWFPAGIVLLRMR